MNGSDGPIFILYFLDSAIYWKTGKTKKDMKKIFHEMMRLLLLQKEYAKRQIESFLTENKDNLLEIMGEGYYTAFKASKYVAGKN